MKSFLVAALIYLVSVGLLLLWLLSKTDHHFIYYLDDPYIHMAMAKNFALHGVWGITPYEFSSSSSSTLWTLLLSGVYKVFGVSIWPPFILNIIFSIFAIFISYKIIEKFDYSKAVQTAILLLLTFAIPLPTLTFSGMEHVLHLALLLLAYYFFIEYLETSSTRYMIFLLCTVPFLALERYESLAAIVIFASFLWLRKERSLALALFAFALLPLINFGLFSLYEGGWFIPVTSLKVHAIRLKNLHLSKARQYLIPVFFVGLSFFFYLLRQKRYPYFDKLQVGLTLAAGMTIAHLLLAPIGGFYRYEAYFLGFDFLILMIAFLEITREKQWLHHHYFLTIALGVALIAPITIRGLNSYTKVPLASKNIYDQQYQMSQFIHNYYPTGWIACNDIGAITFYNDHIRCFDLAGIGNLQVANAMKQDRFTAEFIKQATDPLDLSLIVLYESWYIFDHTNLIPSTWIKVGEWKIPDNIVAGDDVVAFYAQNAQKVEPLIQNLKTYRAHLPHDVKQLIFTTEPVRGR